MVQPTPTSATEPNPAAVRAAEAALQRMGYQKVARSPYPGPSFWVQESEVPRRLFPVFLWDGAMERPLPELNAWRQSALKSGRSDRAIVVVPSDHAAEAALGGTSRREAIGGELAVLVVPPTAAPGQVPRWHPLVLSRREVLDVATGVVTGLFQRAQAQEGSTEIDFQEMLSILRKRFRIDLNASLGVDSDEAALFMMYQLAQRYGFAPGDPGANLHVLVLRPTGPAARLPWFAA
jgi:hypothetical protein